MSCILWVIGEDLDIDLFEEESGLKFTKKTYKGEKRFKKRPDDDTLIPRSLLSVATSESDFDKQVEETLNYLETNFEKLKHIKRVNAVQEANLNFGVDSKPDKFCDELSLPSRLIELAGMLGISLQISIYGTTYLKDVEN